MSMTSMLNTATDEELCSAVREGSPGAFGWLYERHIGEALGYAKKLNYATAEDVVAEVMATVFDLLQQGKGPVDSFRSYVLLCIRNATYRSGPRNLEEPLPDENVLPSTIDLVDVEREESERMVTSALEALPPRWQKAIVLSEIERKSLAEIGEQLQLEPNAVSALLKRARIGLRRSWVSAHFDGAQLADECSETVSAFGAMRWGKPKASERRLLESHLANCDHCAAQRSEYAWLAQAVGMAVLPLIAVGAAVLAASKRGARSVTQTSHAASVGHLAQAAVVLSLGAAAILMPLGDATVAPESVSAPRTMLTEPRSESPLVDSSQVSAEQDQAEASSEAMEGDAADSVAQSPLTTASAPEPAETVAPAPQDSSSQVVLNTWTETISGGTSAFTVLDFLLSDGTRVTAQADAEGKFSLAIPWSEAKPAFSFAISG